jgi:hypothetical protein
VMCVMCNLVSIYFETLLASVEDLCMVCVERTVGLERLLETPDETPRCCGSCGIAFRSILRQCERRCKIGAQFASNIP